MRKGQNLTELDPNRKFQLNKPTSFEYFKIGDNGTTEAIISKGLGRVSIEIDISLGFDVPMEIVYGSVPFYAKVHYVTILNLMKI